MNVPVCPVEDPFQNGYYTSLYLFAKERQPKRGMEIGMLWAVSAAAFLLATEESGSKLDSVDFQNVNAVEQRLEKAGLSDRWSWIQGWSPDILSSLETEIYDWIYVDGEHTYNQALADGRGSYRLLQPGGVILFDDCDAFPEVGRAVRKLSNEWSLEIKSVDGHPHGCLYMEKPL